MKKINENKKISAQEEKFVKIVENEQNKNLLIKKQTDNLRDTSSSPKIRNKNSQQLKILSEDMKTSTNQSISKTPNVLKNRRSIRFKSGFWNNLNKSYKQAANFIKSPNNNFVKFRPDNFMIELRDKMSITHEKMKEKIEKDINLNELIYKKLNSRITKELKEKKHQK